MNYFGINFIAYFDEKTGLSKAANLNLEAISSIIPINKKNIEKKDNKIISQTSTNDYPINLIHINLNYIKGYLEINRNDLKNKYNIAFWAWEFEDVPEEYIEYLNFFDEVWFPSSFSAKAFKLKSPIPILNFSHPIKILESPPYDHSYFGLDKNNFYFLNIFDALSSSQRKNPQGVINAFLKEFKGAPSTYLLIKTSKIEKDKEAHDFIKKNIKENNNIILFNKYFEEDELHSLIKCSNAYVSLHRSEGFGLTIAESMGYGKPVITTGYSGNTDFTNINNSLLNKFKYTQTTKNHGITKIGYKFAEPDIDNAAELMKTVRTSQQVRSHIGLKASEYIKQNHTLEVIGLEMSERLKFIFDNLISNQKQKKEEQLLNIMLKSRVEKLEKKIKKLEKTFFIQIKYLIKRKFKI